MCSSAMAGVASSVEHARNCRSTTSGHALNSARMPRKTSSLYVTDATKHFILIAHLQNEPLLIDGLIESHSVERVL